jgi:uncharacterized protein
LGHAEDKALNMRIAVAGSGIAGLASAYMLSREHDVTLFEANGYLGGHTHTHEVEHEGRAYNIDTGFIVFNTQHYPLLTALFEELGVITAPTSMSFSVQNAQTGLEYNATSLDGLFCQRRNLLSPRFLRMVQDITRFYREAPALLARPDNAQTLGDYLAEHRYGKAFRDDHLVPMASALWSSPAKQILGFPIRYLVQFMANHHMLQVTARPTWRVVEGGSASYVRAMRSQWKVRERLACPIRKVRRYANTVDVSTDLGTDTFDHVVLACHSDQALALLEDADAAEREILGAIRYQANDTVLHTDAALLPRHRKAWAAWNAYIPAHAGEDCTVSYCMNILQGVTSREPFVVTLNRTAAIDPSRVLRRMTYHHPIYDQASVSARVRKHEIQGRRRTWFAGAYWGWGFHEDGMRSAIDVVQGMHRIGAESDATQVA